MPVVTRSQSKAAVVEAKPKAESKPNAQKGAKAIVNVIPEESPLSLPIVINDRCIVCKDKVIDCFNGYITLDPKGVIVHECRPQYKALYHKDCAKSWSFNSVIGVNFYYCFCCKKAFCIYN